MLSDRSKRVKWGSGTITFFGVLAAGPDALTAHPHCTDLPMVG